MKEFYKEQQEMMDRVCEDIRVCKELIKGEDSPDVQKLGVVPGLNNMDTQVKAMEDQLQKLKEGIFQVLFTGGFNAGKSTLLNALMRKAVLNMSIKAETAVITKIVFNADEKVIVFKKQLQKDGQPVKEVYTVEQFFKKYRVSQENPELFTDIDYVQLQQSQDGIGGSLVQLVDSPGTLNSSQDTEAARNFAEKASAVVYLINASMPFTDDDKTYIKDHYSGKELKNLFFIINRFDCVQPGEVEVLKEGVKEQLRQVFTFNGKFDEEFFNSRVFYTNAYGSLNTRTGQKTRTPYGDFMVDDSQTGVPQFEEALEKFLTDDDRDRAVLAAYIPKLATIYTVAEERAQDGLKRYREGIDKLLRDRDDLSESIAKSESSLKGIETACENAATNILLQIKQAYDNYTIAVENGWDAHFEDKDVLSAIDFHTLDMMKLALTKDKKRQEQRMEPIQKAVREYIESKSRSLRSNIDDIVSANISSLEKTLKIYQEQLERLECPVDINKIMSSINVAKAQGGTADPEIKINLFQLLLGIAGADPDVAIDALNGSKTNTQAVISSISKNLFEYIAFYVVAWPIGLAMLAKRAFDIIRGWKNGGNNSARELLKGLKAGTVQGLRDGKSKMAMDMEKTVGGSIIRAGFAVSEGIRQEFAGYQASFDEMIENLNNKNFSIQQEEERTAKLLEELVNRISHISELTTGKKLDAAGVIASAEGTGK